MASYFDRQGALISSQHWAGLRADPNYWPVRQYDNGEVRVEIEWLGKETDTNTFRDYFRLFRINVWNYNAIGERKKDPVEDGKTFAYEDIAIKAYEDFLERWTACHRNQDGEFEEEDNSLTPPPPPDPDAPSTDASEVESVKLGDDDVGVW